MLYQKGVLDREALSVVIIWPECAISKRENDVEARHRGLCIKGHIDTVELCSWSAWKLPVLYLVPTREAVIIATGSSKSRDRNGGRGFHTSSIHIDEGGSSNRALCKVCSSDTKQGLVASECSRF